MGARPFTIRSLLMAAKTGVPSDTSDKIVCNTTTEGGAEGGVSVIMDLRAGVHGAGAPPIEDRIICTDFDLLDFYDQYDDDSDCRGYGVVFHLDISEHVLDADVPDEINETISHLLNHMEDGDSVITEDDDNVHISDADDSPPHPNENTPQTNDNRFPPTRLLSRASEMVTGIARKATMMVSRRRPQPEASDSVDSNINSIRTSSPEMYHLMRSGLYTPTYIRQQIRELLDCLVSSISEGFNLL
eukprot:GHVO01032567.1.p1 GENE.GHVO01032567.1~~GHVO01032567.1.p1  ORF type:complete len:252 (+),score=46.89 GHVO01032567.1:27-758(+)